MRKFADYLRPIIVFLLLLFSCGTYAQTLSDSIVSFTPNGVLDSVYDQYGNSYRLNDIAINDTLRSVGKDSLQILNAQTTYTSGYFKLYLDKNCGMENYATDANHLARLQVICQMLQDVSQFINSPCTSSGQTINIWCRDISLVPNLPANSHGIITSFYNIPSVTGMSGIADNTVWKTLNSGTDAYQNIGVPWNNAFNSGTTFFHAMLAFNFTGTEAPTWNTSLTSGPANDANTYDLYTEALHQVVHALGFASLIGANGQSVFGANHPFYSRYDMNLKTVTGTSLLSHTGSVSMYNYAFGMAATVLAPGGTCYPDSTVCSSAIKYYGGLSLPQAVYTPNCFERGVSLGNFEDACRPAGSTEPMANNQYFVMSNVTPAGNKPGNLKRYLQQEERQVLNDIGYSVNNTFGNPTNVDLNYISYATSYTIGGQVAGNNDGISNGAYTLVADASGTLTFTGSALLGNDAGVTGGTFEGLQIVSGSGSFSVSGGNASTSITWSGATDGVSIFSYVPVGANGHRGNTVFGPLGKLTGVCTATTCNYVPNPGFETATGCGPTVVPAPGSATGAPSCWQPFLNTPDLYATGCSTTNPYASGWSFNVPDANTTFATAVPAHTGGGNNYIGLWSSYNISAGAMPTFNPEGIQVPLGQTLTAGQTYTVTLWAMVAPIKTALASNAYILPGSINIGLSSSALVPSTGAFTAVPATFTNLHANLKVPAPTSNNSWVPLSFVFTCPATGFNNLVVYNSIDLNTSLWGNIYPTIFYGGYIRPYYSSYILVDDVQLAPGNTTVTAAASPATVCGGGSVTLTATASGATYSWTPTAAPNGVACSTCASTTAHPTSSTNYQVTATFPSGCSYTVPVPVTVGSVNISSNLTSIYSGQSVILSATGGTNYTWTSTPASAISPINMPESMVSALPTSSSVPTTTVYTATSNGCSSSISINVTQAPAKSILCSAATLFPGMTVPVIANATLGSWPYAAGSALSVTGALHLQGSMTISNTNFWMGSLSAIILDNGASVTFSNCHFFTCLISPDSWGGIAFSGSTGSVYFTNGTLLEDAVNGVLVNGTTPASGKTYVVKSDGATFNRCSTDISISNYPSISAPLTSYFSIVNTVFTSRDFERYNDNVSLSYPKVWPPLQGTFGLKTPLPPANNYQPPYNINSQTIFMGAPFALVGMKSFGPAIYGLYMNSVGYSSGCNLAGQSYVETAIGDESNVANKNIFDGLRTGIYNYNSNLSSVNNAFMNMTYYNAAAPGDGIYSYASGFCDRLRVWNNGGTNSNEFYDCVNAVDAPNISEIIGQNAKIVSSTHSTGSLGQTTTSGSFGYNLHSWSFYNADISNNNITNVSTGVFAQVAIPQLFGSLFGNGPMNVSNNVIQAANGSGATAPCMLQAINVQNLLNCVWSCPVGAAGVTLNTNTLTGVYNGILCNGFKQQVVTCNLNPVTMALQGGQPSQYGIEVVNCQTPTIKTNTVSGPTGTSYTDDKLEGIYTGANTAQTVTCNAVSNVGRGFEFGGNETNTYWANNTMLNTGKGMMINTGYINRQVPGIGSLVIIAEAANNQWLAPTAPGLSWGPTYPATYMSGSLPGSSPLYVNVASGPTYLPIAAANQGNPPIDAYQIGPTIINTPFSAPNCSGKLQPVLVSNVYTGNPFVLTVTGQVGFDGSAVVSTWMDQMGVWEYLQVDPTPADSLAEVAEFSTQAANSRFKYLTDIEGNVTNGLFDDALALVSAPPAGNAYTDPATGVVVADYGSADYVVANYTSFYNIVIKAAEGGMTADDTVQLLALANLCPFTNGTVVYQARSLYDAVTGNPLVWSDGDACSGGTAAPPAERSAPPTTAIAPIPAVAGDQDYSLYPNPNNGNVNLQQAVADAGPVNSEIWDGAGRKVYKGTLQFSNRTARINLGSAPAGLYLVQLRDSAGKNYTLKFVVAKDN